MNRAEYRQLNEAFLNGELILGIKYRHNSQVSIIDEDGERVTGWIVGVDTHDSEPIYTIEISGGDPNYEVKQSEIVLLHDPHV
ncbi:hypothetical protein [Rheinheimera sp. F8]|uniref:hypothetical protein n=1 Tax=Rheinheimera sp. F8 TaxID=1763998 RepID=UPI0007449A17|nr:hypothetical protein [Rheinheimera sp. F8]ALZ75289.1 hypothetical protein ATY27_05650 [Rheinheimera sp. F8]ALZ76285.1 hypothetical protein ATY27_11295 [Rheinheimera sp. F8]